MRKPSTILVFGVYLAMGLSILAIYSFVGIWTINTLFDFNIAYNFKNWTALFLLLLISKFKFSIKHK
jgi:hypothetical protein